MEQNILLSKIAASPTQNAWAQAYSTHYLYVVLSIKKTDLELDVTALGKELLERLNREFFSLPEKRLEYIKQAVTATLTEGSDTLEYSLVVATVIHEVLYIVIAHGGFVIIKRGGTYHTIAEGKTGSIEGFSGKLKHNDLVILETSDFSTKIPLDTIQGIPNVSSVLDLSENIAPLIHSEALGSEAAIFLQYQQFAHDFTPQPAPVENDPSLAEAAALPETKPVEEEPLDVTNARKSIALPKVGIPKVTFKKRFVLLALIIILAVIFGYLLMKEKNSKAETQEKTALLEVLEPARAKYNEGMDMMSLNEALALDDIREAEKMLLERRDDFQSNSEAKAEYDELLAQIQSKLTNSEQGSSIKATVFFDPKGQISAITTKGGIRAAASAQTVDSVSKDGSVEKSYSIDASKPIDITANENVILVLGENGIYQIDKGGSSGKRIIESSNLAALDMFGSNLYALEGNNINKYGGEGFSKSSYFASSPKFESGISDFAIDGAVFVVEKNGILHKFLKGIEENFSTKSLPTPIGKNAKVFTGEGINYLYVLDPGAKKVVVLTKDGEYKSSYNVAVPSAPTAFAVDEQGGVIYLVSGGNVYSSKME